MRLHDFISSCFGRQKKRFRLHRARALPPHVQPPPQQRPLPFGSSQALQKKVALTAALVEFGIEAAAARQPCDQIANEPPE